MRRELQRCHCSWLFIPRGWCRGYINRALWGFSFAGGEFRRRGFTSIAHRRSCACRTRRCSSFLGMTSSRLCFGFVGFDIRVIALGSSVHFTALPSSLPTLCYYWPSFVTRTTLYHHQPMKAVLLPQSTFLSLKCLSSINPSTQFSWWGPLSTVFSTTFLSPLLPAQLKETQVQSTLIPPEALGLLSTRMGKSHTTSRTAQRPRTRCLLLLSKFILVKSLAPCKLESLTLFLSCSPFTNFYRNRNHPTLPPHY